MKNINYNVLYKYLSVLSFDNERINEWKESMLASFGYVSQDLNARYNWLV